MIRLVKLDLQAAVAELERRYHSDDDARWLRHERAPTQREGVHMLRRVTIERRADGRFHMLREMESSTGERTGDTWTCSDLIDAFGIVRNGFFPNGENRPAAPSQRQSMETKGE